MTHTDVAQALVKAPPGQVFAALVEKEARAVWLPPAGMSGSFSWFDARVGGGYRMTLRYDDGAGQGKSSQDTDVIDARFVRIDEPSHLVEEADFVSDDPDLAGTMTMTWTLGPVADGTLVVITATDVPDGISSQDHTRAFASTLRNLDEYVTRALT